MKTLLVRRFMMLKIGCHLSVSKGFFNMGKVAQNVNANTFQFFTRNPQGGKAKALDEADAAALSEFMKEQNFAPIVAHAPYTMNACSAEKRLRAFAKNMMLDDLARLEHLPGNYYNFHPGSHVKQGVEVGIELIVSMLNEVLTPNQSTIVLLETMAGKGSEIGGSFEELAAIIEQVEVKSKLGVCLDTCHVHDAGYDIVNDLDGVLTEFDNIIGIEKLYAIHINDSKNPLGSKKDRHEVIGSGFIGEKAMKNIINHPSLRELSFLLETPNDLEGYAQEIALLKKLYE